MLERDVDKRSTIFLKRKWIISKKKRDHLDLSKEERESKISVIKRQVSKL